MGKLISIILVIICPFVMIAQSNQTTIQGRLLDSLTGENLSNASIVLMKLPDSMIIRQSISSKNGFVISKIPLGKFLLRISYIGYRDTILNINIQEEDSIYQTGTLKMIKSADHMMEVVIRSVIPPVIMKNDTIMFNTTSFQTRPNATVEELLKKLPGVEVDKDGNITVHGQIVQKIFIDGKEFFFNDPKIATQNLLADMVQKVEVFNEKSERARLTGIADNDPPKVLNLRLKPDKKKGVFGNISGGYSNNEAYNLKVNGNYFKGDAYFFAAANKNSGSLQEVGPQRRNAKGLSFSYRDSWNEKLQFNSSISIKDNDVRNSITMQRVTFFADSSLMQDMPSATNSNGSTIGVNLKLNYSIDSFSKMEIGSEVSFFHFEQSATNSSSTVLNKGSLSYLLNNAGTFNVNTNSGNNFNLYLNYHRGFRKRGRYLEVRINKANWKDKSTRQLTSATRIYDMNGLMTDSLFRNQWSAPSSNSSNFGLIINYTEPLAKGQILDFSYSLKQSGAEAYQQAYNYNPATNKYDEMDSLASNSFMNKNIAQLFSVGYNYLNKKLKCQLGFSVQLTKQDNNNLSGNRSDIKQHFSNVTPKASLIYSFTPQKSLTITYNGSSLQPTIDQLQPVPDYSNPLLIRLGNPSLKTAFINTFSLTYKYFTKNGTQNLTIQTAYTNIINRIASSVHINAQGIQEHQYVNVNGNYNFTSRLNYALNFRLHKNPQKGRMNMNTSLGYSRHLSLVNNRGNLLQTFSAGKRLDINYNPFNKLFTDFSAGFSWNYSAYSIQEGNTGSFISHNYSYNFSYELPWGLELASAINLQFTNGQKNFEGTKAAIWNAHLSKKLFTNGSGELKILANDILNDGNDFYRMVSDNYIEVTQTNIVKRFFVLSFLYRFRSSKI